MRHGRQHNPLAFALLAAFTQSAHAATPPPEDQVPRANRAEVEVTYTINPEAKPIQRVELWYTFDDGNTWLRYGEDPDRQPPMMFAPRQEGLCGLYFIVVNAAGASGEPPGVATEPHLWLFIDPTPPIVQMHPATITSTGSERIAHLRWTAIDSFLLDRPISLSYRQLPDGPWLAVKDQLPNVGVYDWPLPESLHGEVMFRLSVQDRGGNITHAASPAVRVDQVVAETASAKPIEAAPLPEQPRVLSFAEQKRVRDLLRRARVHQLRQEHDAAISRLREALALDPRCAAALVDLGASLYALGRFEDAAGANELALEHAPQNEEALAGLAESLVALQRYEEAEAKLRKLLENQPLNASAWLHLGDIAVYRGHELDARDCYAKAGSVRPEAKDIVTRAQARLDALTQRGLARGANGP